jgi:hypothetical protein
MDDDYKREMGDTEKSIAYWKARNDPAAADEQPEPDVTRPVSQRDEE